MFFYDIHLTYLDIIPQTPATNLELVLWDGNAKLLSDGNKLPIICRK